MKPYSAILALLFTSHMVLCKDRNLQIQNYQQVQNV